MENALQNQLDNVKSFSEFKPKDEFNINLDFDGKIYLGNNYYYNLINVWQPDVILNFANAPVRVDITNPVKNDVNIFYISHKAKNVVIENLKLYVYLNCPINFNKITAICNTAVGVKIRNCHIEIISENATNLTGIINLGNQSTLLSDKGDNLIAEKNFINIKIINRSKNISSVCGFNNNFANSILVKDNFIYTYNIGYGKNQTSTGIYTDGKFGRFINNNIKANGSHNTGNETQQAFTYGFINDGSYNFLEGNNIVGEWGGQCIGLENKGGYAKVSGNKILSTHTIKGRSIRNYSQCSLFYGNIITSTSRNPRLFEQNGSYCIFNNNLLEGLQGTEIYKSSVGIYAAEESATGNIIFNNIIKNVCDCGIFMHKNTGKVKDNLFITYPDCTQFKEISTVADLKLLNKLNEANIKSVY